MVPAVCMPLARYCRGSWWVRINPENLVRDEEAAFAIAYEHLERAFKADDAHTFATLLKQAGYLKVDD